MISYYLVKAMAVVFRGKYLQELKNLIAAQSISFSTDIIVKDFINHLFVKDWVVYAKKPLGGPQQVIEYLGKYTHSTRWIVQVFS